ncbi:MAG: NADH-quinone oxidoreductase subunit NuoF [bacterium]
MALQVPIELERRMDDLIRQYPEDRRRAATLWLLHLLQEHYGCLGRDQVEWAAAKLQLAPINVWELIRFYPMFSETPRGRFHIKVCRSVSCEQCGCGSVFRQLQELLGVPGETVTPDGLFSVSAVECLASCGSGPVMMINDELYENLTPADVERMIAGIRATGRVEAPALPLLPTAHALERRLLMTAMSRPGYTGSLEDYLAAGGYQSLPMAFGLKPEQTIREVAESRLKGRGGAGFPTGVKWKYIDRRSGRPIYLVCNADESEPGTFKDRQLIYRDPHLLIEGILITCYAIGARTAYIYIRGEFAAGARILARAIEEARKCRYVGRNIMDSGFSCELFIHRGAGAYICGEETGLIESLEGKRAYPRIKPPFPAVRGLFDCPTVVNNVETLCTVPFILRNGSEWFRSLGVAGSFGTRIISLSGSVKRPGCYEIEMGKVTLRQLIDEIGGGTRRGNPVKAVIPGGSSMPMLPPDKLDVTLDFDAIQAAGSLAGSGGVIVLEEGDDVVERALSVARFYAHESCGQCTPCREGTLWMEKIIERLHRGQGRPADVDLLMDVADHIDGTTICALGEAAAWPVKAFLRHCRADFEKAAGGGHP